MEHENSEKERNGNVDGGGGEENWCACSRAEIQTKHDGLIWIVLFFSLYTAKAVSSAHLCMNERIKGSSLVSCFCRTIARAHTKNSNSQKCNLVFAFAFSPLFFFRYLIQIQSNFNMHKHGEAQMELKMVAGIFLTSNSWFLLHFILKKWVHLMPSTFSYVDHLYSLSCER